MPIHSTLRLLVIAGSLLLLLGCGADPRTESDPATPGDDALVAPAEDGDATRTTTPLPAPPTADAASTDQERPVTYARPRRAFALDTLSLNRGTGWLDFHRTHGSPSLRWANFAPTDTTTVDEFPVLDYRPDADFYELAVPDAEDRRRIDIYGFEAELRERRGQRQRIGEDGSAVLLIEGDLVRQLMFCGTPCTYEAAHWTGPEEVTILGKIVTTDGAAFHPYAWVIDLEQQRIVTLRGDRRMGTEGDFISTRLN